MRLSYREKESLYRSLAQLVRSGLPFPTAVEKLAATSSGRFRTVLRGFREAMDRQEDVGAAFASQKGVISPMESSVVVAVARSGRLEHGLQQLAEYFAALAQARATVIRKSAYPVFILHFGVFLLGTPKLVTIGIGAYLRQIGVVFAVIYAVAGIAALLIRALREAGANNPSVDRILRRVPLIGKVRRAFALSRFCLIYDIQLDAAVNVIDALFAAGRASGSGLIQRAVQNAVPEIRTGSTVAALLGTSGAFPQEMMTALMIAEETGGLDRELPRLFAEFQREALLRLETAAEWSAKLLYVSVVLYLAWGIVTTYVRAMSTYGKMLDM